MLVNLLGNAVRYASGKPGSIRVFPVLDATGRVELHVQDDGPGITPEVRAHLFEPFYTTSSKGTGLGLYLARELCLNNGAMLDYEYRADGRRRRRRAGGRFVITFAGPALKYRHSVTENLAMSSPRILVVDDEADLRELLEITLLKMGLDVDSAATVREARALLGQQEYALVLTDMRLPDGTGPGTGARSRRQPPQHADRRDHRLRQRRERGGRAEGRRLRLRVQAGGAGRPARAWCARR